MTKAEDKRKRVPSPAERRQLAVKARKAKKKYILYENVLGVGHGPVEKDGLLTGEWGIIVLVKKKLPKKEVRKGELIDRTFEGVRVDVREPRLTDEAYKAFLEKNDIQLRHWDDLPDTFLVDPYKVHLINLKRLKRITAEGMEIPKEGPVTAVFDEIFVIEDDGSIVTDPGLATESVDHIEAFKVFQNEFGDDYDILFFLHDSSSGMNGGGGACPTIYNDITGINHYRGDNYNDRASWGTNKVQSYCYVHSNNIRHWLHEIVHRWLAFANHMEGGVESQNLHEDLITNNPGQGGYHWGNWFDDDDSCIDYDRFDWVDVVGGYEQDHLMSGSLAVDEFHLHPLDLYLMGMIRANEVPTFRYIENPTDDNNDGVFQGTQHNISVNDVIAVPDQGARNPSCDNSQRVIHIAFIIITQNLAGVGDLTAGVVHDFNEYRLGVLQRFRESTWGRGILDGSLLHSNFSDIYIRDNVNDLGSATSTGSTWNSPDVWVRNIDDGLEIHQNTIRGQSNYLHARVWNKSTIPYEDVTVRFYLGNTYDLVPGTRFYYPEDWKLERLLGEETIDVPAGAPGAPASTIAKIEWTQDKIPPSTGWHPCLLIEILPTEVTPNTRHARWENKKIAQKNITIVDGPGDPEEGHLFKFEVGHLYDKPKVSIIAVERLKSIEGLEVAIATQEDSYKIIPDLSFQRPPKPDYDSITKLDLNPQPPILIKHAQLGQVFIPQGTWIGLTDSDNKDTWKTIKITNDTVVKLGYGRLDQVSLKHRKYLLHGKQYHILPDWYRTVICIPGVKNGTQLVTANIRVKEQAKDEKVYLRFMEYDENLILVGGVDYEIRM